VLAPLLFILFINDLAFDLRGVNRQLFADDTLIAHKMPKADGPARGLAIDKIQSALNSLQQWCDKWQIQLNAGKTSCMIFSKRPNLNNKPNGPKFPHWKLGEHKIQPTTNPSIRYLGVFLDRSLTFKYHVEVVRNRAQQRLKVLKYLSGNLNGGDVITLKTLYITWIRPILEYGT